jgi:hypothetical protein
MSQMTLDVALVKNVFQMGSVRMKTTQYVVLKTIFVTLHLNLSAKKQVVNLVHVVLMGLVTEIVMKK